MESTAKAKFDSMVFYRGWLATARKKLPEEETKTLVIQLIEYGLDGKKPKKFTSDLAETIFLMAMPSIDTNIKKKVGGQKGVRRKAEKKSDGKTIGLNNVDVGVDADADAHRQTDTSAQAHPGRESQRDGDTERPTDSETESGRRTGHRGRHHIRDGHSASEAEPPSGEESGESGETTKEWEWHDPEEYISSKRTTSSDSPESKG